MKYVFSLASINDNEKTKQSDKEVWAYRASQLAPTSDRRFFSASLTIN